MAVSPLALKGLLGVGAVSTAAVGTWVLNENGFFESSLENLVFNPETGETYLTWSVEAKDTTKVKGSLIGKSSKGKIWTCNLESSVSSGTAAPDSAGIIAQLSTLKTSIGLDSTNNKITDSTKKEAFKKFIDNCKRHSSPDKSTRYSFESTINLGSASSGSDSKHKLNDSEITKLHTGIYLDGTLKTKIKTDLEISSFNIPTESSDSSNTINNGNLGKINFFNKDDGKNLTIDVTDATAKLKIETTKYSDIFPEGLKFTFADISKDITLKNGNDESTKILLKKGTNPEFRLNRDKNNKFFLEPAWNLKTLGEKAGLSCEVGADECGFKESGINVFKGTDDYVIGAKVSSTDKIKVIKDDTYNQGFKFEVDKDVSFTGGDNPKTTEGISKLTNKSTDNTSYEIKFQTISEKEGWFLVKKSS